MPSTAHGRMRAVAAAFVRGHVVAAVATTTTLALVGRSSGDDGHRDPEEAGSGRSYLEAAGSGRIDPGGSDEWTADVRAAATTAWDNSKRRCRRQQPLVWVATDRTKTGRLSPKPQTKTEPKNPKTEISPLDGGRRRRRHGRAILLPAAELDGEMTRGASMFRFRVDLRLVRKHGRAEAGGKTRIRQSVLYSERKRQSRRGRGRGVAQPPTLPAMVRTGSMNNDFPDSATAELPAVEEALSPREGFTAMLNGFRDPPKDVGQRSAKLAQSSKPCPRELDTQSSQKSRQVSESISSATEDLSCHKLSTEEIIQNGKRWMSEEVMLAFKKYIKGRDEFMDVACTLDELQHQCFSVNAYHEVFHHYNFTVKLKKPTSEDTLTYFAEVKQVYGEKIYLCCPLKPNDNGYCHACVNQGMNALKHPPNDDVGFEIGHFNTGFPFMYLSDDDSDGVWVPAENDMDLFDSVFD
uniref:DUF3615 domain-containing protein n=1 Tax=Leersia perrieri TaxID=77586 RepID=A0A0D9XUT2_9ORYZ